MTNKTEKQMMVEIMAKIKAKHLKKHNCALGKKRCTTCDIVASDDLFPRHAAVCKPCTAIQMRKYYDKRRKEELIELKANGEKRNPVGRPAKKTNKK